MPLLPPTTAHDPYERLMELIHHYTTFTTLTELVQFRWIVSPEYGRCAFRGCTEPVVWGDNHSGFFVYEGYYRTLQSWIEEERKGYF